MLRQEHKAGERMIVDRAGDTMTGVTRAHRNDPDLDSTYCNFAQLCGFGIVPARAPSALAAAASGSAVNAGASLHLIVRPRRASMDTGLTDLRKETTVETTIEQQIDKLCRMTVACRSAHDGSRWR